VPFKKFSNALVSESQVDQNNEPRFLENVKLFLQRAAKKTNVPQDMYNLIESCASVIRFNIPLRMDSGEIRTIACYR
jgi:glutamate dehydrogenase/leucine dehydrogenase